MDLSTFSLTGWWQDIFSALIHVVVAGAVVRVAAEFHWLSSQQVGPLLMVQHCPGW